MSKVVFTKWYHTDHESCEVLPALFIKFYVTGATATHVAGIHAHHLHSACNIFHLISYASKMSPSISVLRNYKQGKPAAYFI